MIQLALVILSALAPVAVLLWYIIKKDEAKPEPTRWLLKAFVFGVLSALLSFAFSVPVGLLFDMDLDASTYTSIVDALADAFLLAAKVHYVMAIAEEKSAL